MTFTFEQAHGEWGAPTAAAAELTANDPHPVLGGAIAFGETAYQPDFGLGRGLISHELAHVVRQRGGTGGPSDAEAHPLGMSGPGYSIGRPLAVQRALDDRSPGRPLDTPHREGFPTDFDFSEVRVHTDDSAAALAAGVGADAFTRGTDIYFGASLYQPNSPTGEMLLRHELTHVLQHASGEVSEFAGLVVPPEHPTEVRAQPHSALRGRTPAAGVRNARGQRQAIQRQPSVTGHVARDAPPASRSLTEDWVQKIHRALSYDVAGLEPSLEELQAFNRMADVDHDHVITLGELVNALDCTEKMTARAWFANAIFFRDYRMDRNLQKLSGEFDRNAFARRLRDDARAFEQNENQLRAGPEGNYTNREGREATKRELNRHRDLRRLLPLAAVAATVIFPEAVAVISAWDTGVKTGETITGKRSGVRVWDILTGKVGVAGTEMTESERAEAGKDAVLGWAAIGVAFVLSRPPAAPSGPPQITFGDVKSINSYEAGLRHVSEMEGRAIYNTSGNVGLALYDAKDGAVFLQVFGPRAGASARTVMWEGQIGTIQIPQGMTPTQIGNAVEEEVRQLVGRTTGQTFPTKAANAPGPDLHIPATK